MAKAPILSQFAVCKRMYYDTMWVYMTSNIFVLHHPIVSPATVGPTLNIRWILALLGQLHFLISRSSPVHVVFNWQFWAGREEDRLENWRLCLDPLVAQLPFAFQVYVAFRISGPPECPSHAVTLSRIEQTMMKLLSRGQHPSCTKDNSRYFKFKIDGHGQARSIELKQNMSKTPERK